MKLSDFIEKIDKRIPRAWAEDWDNPGLAFGDEATEICRVAVALDATVDTVSRAAEAGCQLIFTHHPLIFRALKHLYPAIPPQETLICAVRKNIALFAAHTNWDSSPEGVNVILANSLGLKNVGQLERTENDSFGIGAVGDFEKPLTFREIMVLVRNNWKCENITGFGDETRKIQRVAVGGGACGSMWHKALDKGAQLFITADISYHDRNEALYKGLNLIICDHGEMERMSLDKLCAIISEETGVEVVRLQEDCVKRITVADKY